MTRAGVPAAWGSAWAAVVAMWASLAKVTSLFPAPFHRLTEDTAALLAWTFCCQAKLSILLSLPQRTFSETD